MGTELSHSLELGDQWQRAFLDFSYETICTSIWLTKRFFKVALQASKALMDSDPVADGPNTWLEKGGMT